MPGPHPLSNPTASPQPQLRCDPPLLHALSTGFLLRTAAAPQRRATCYHNTHTHTHTHTLLQQEYYEYIILDAEHELNFEVMKRLGEPQWLVSVTLTHKYTLSLSLPHVHPHTLFDVMVRLGEP